MSDANSAKKLLPTQRVPFTPLSTDVFVVEQFNVVQSPNDSIPAYGTAHDTISKLKSWPNHSFCLQTEPDDQGNYQRVYVANQGTQHLYNWEISDAPDWPTVTQTFIVPRATYVYPDPTPSVTYPPPPNTNTVITGYEITSTEEQRIGEPRLDSLYVAVKVTREKVSLTQTRKYVDLDTNTLRTEVTQKVAAGTASSAVNASGNYTDITPLNAFWSTSSTKKAQGLAGNAVLGVASRTMYYRDNYTWPRVLNYILIQPVLANPGDIYSPATSFSWQPVWLADAFDGPCDYTLVERWTLEKPILGGNPSWNTTTGGSPDIPQETPMLKQEINFQGTDLRIFIPACLHEDYSIWDTQFRGFYPATNPTRWPATILARVTISPDQGGWLTRMFYVDAPSTAGVATGITLSQTGSTSTTVDLLWAIDADVPAGTIKLNVATDPTFASGFLSGFQNLTVTGTTKTVTGLTRGQVYYATISRGGITSNISIILADPTQEMTISSGGITIVSGGSLNVGSVEVGTGLPTTLALSNLGLEPINDIVSSLSGADAAMFSMASFESTVANQDTAVLTFTPTSTGAKAAILSIASSDPNTPYVINLSGTGLQREINIQYLSVSYASGSNIEPIGTVAAGATQQYTLSIQNTGTSALTISSSGVTGTGWSVITAPDGTVAASGSTNMVIQIAPTVAGASVGTVTVNSNDASEPAYVLYVVVQVTATPEIVVEAIGNSTPSTWDIPMVDAVSTFDFGTLNGVATRSLSFKITNNGYADLTGIAVTGAAGFVVSALSGVTAAPGASVTFSVAYTSATPAVFPGTLNSGTLTITSNDADEGTFTLTMQGYCMNSALQLSQIEQPKGTILVDAVSTVDYGSVLLSSPSAKTWVWRNIGNSNLAPVATVTGTNSADFVASGIAGLLSSTNTTVVSDDFLITFTPSGYGVRTASVALSGGGITIDVALTGVGVPADALVTGQSADVIVGQVDATTQSTTPSAIVTPNPVCSAISSTGRLAVGDVTTGEVYIWNTIPVASGTAADIILDGSTSGVSGFTPSGLAWDGANLWVSDANNHRILRYTNPITSSQEASLVLGQADFSGVSVNRGGAVAANTLFFPRRIVVTGGKLIVADSDNNRVLIWNAVPTTNGASADVAVGQANLTSNSSGTTSTTMLTPYGVSVTASGTLVVADSGNNRVIQYANIPTSSGEAAVYAQGQANLTSGTANRGGAAAANTLDNPTDVMCSSAGGMAIADQDNNRVIMFYDTPATTGGNAHAVLGQTTFTATTAATSGASVMSGPTGVTWDDTNLLVTGTAMRRTMIFSP